MKNFAILMLIFGVLIILFGLYIYTGHDALLARGYYKKKSKKYLRYLGKSVIVTSLAPIISGISAFIVKDDSLIPVIILIVSFIIIFFIISKHFKESE